MVEKVSYKEMVQLYNEGFSRLENRFIDLSNQIHTIDIKFSKKIEEIMVQTTRTNGRVTNLESKEAIINKIIEELKLENKSQNAKLIKYGAAITIIITVIYFATGYLIPFLIM